MVEINKQSINDWFIIQVTTSKEYFIKDFIERYAAEKIRMIIFSKELLFERKQKVFKDLSPLFPGYIFIHRKVEKALNIIRENLKSEFIKPICFKAKERKCQVCFSDKSPCRVENNEMEFFLSAADESGVIGLSQGIRKGEKIKIVNGPLMHLTNKILWVNQKKKRACVEIELFMRKMQVTLGFEAFTL